MNLSYNGFRAHCYFSLADGTFVGEVLDIPYVISFSAQTWSTLTQAMQEAVQAYGAFCEAKEVG